MSKYKFEYSDEGCRSMGPLKIAVESETESLPDVLEIFKQFLQAVGFGVDGDIKIVKED